MADPWMKFYPADWMSEPKLKLVSRAARSLWIDMLCLMHQAGTGRLEMAGRPMTERELAAILGDNPRTIRKLMSELREAGVSTTVDGSFVASSRIIRDFKKAERDRSNGRMGGNPSLKTRENREKGVNPEVKAQKPEARSQKEKETPNGVSKKRRVGTRLEPDWVLPDDFRDWAIEQNYPQAAVDRQAEQFRDFWISKTGRDATKLDWFATWRNWMRNARIPQPVPNSSPPRPTSSEQQSQSVQRLVAVLEADERKRAQ